MRYLLKTAFSKSLASTGQEKMGLKLFLSTAKNLEIGQTSTAFQIVGTEEKGKQQIRGMT